MYGGDISSGVVGGSLAATGLAVGSYVLLGLGLLFVVIGVIALFKKNSIVRP